MADNTTTTTVAVSTTAVGLNHPGHTHSVSVTAPAETFPEGAFFADEEWWAEQYSYLSETAATIAQKLVFALILAIVGVIVIKIIVWVLKKVFARPQIGFDQAVSCKYIV
jgi:hypothetical protein